MTRQGRAGSLGKATLIQLAGNASYLASQLLVLVALTWLTDVETVGTYALAQAIASPIFAVSEMRLEQVRLTRRAFAYKFYLVHRIVSSAVALVFIMLAGYAFTEGAITGVLAAVGVYKSLESLLRLLLAEHMRREQSNFVAFVQVVRALTTSLAFVCVLNMYSLQGAVFAAAIMLIVPTTFSFLILRGTSSTDDVSEVLGLWGSLKALTAAAFPIGLSYYFGVITANLPRYVIEAVLGRDALGVFSVAAYGVVLFNTVVETTLQVTMPRLSTYWGSGKREAYVRLIRRSSGAVLGAGMIGLAVAYFIGRDMLTLIFGFEYSAASSVLVMLLIAAVVQNQSALLRGALIATHSGRPLVVVSLINLLTVAACVHSMVRWGGLEGAGLALAAGQLTSLLGHGILWKRVVAPSGV